MFLKTSLLAMLLLSSFIPALADPVPEPIPAPVPEVATNLTERYAGESCGVNGTFF